MPFHIFQGGLFQSLQLKGLAGDPAGTMNHRTYLHLPRHIIIPEHFMQLFLLFFLIFSDALFRRAL
jgi:hypothetical protein